MGLRARLRFRILVFMADTADVLPAFAGNRPTVEHFRDGRFFNPGVVDHDFRTALRWMTHRNIGPWRRWIESTPGPAPPALVDGGDLRATFVNHATVLLQVGGMNILTDPVWSRRVSPVQFAGPARHRAPGIRFEDLPAIHVLLISHNHYDHFDVPTLKRIAAVRRPVVFCPLGLEAPLRGLGFRDVSELDWWESQPGPGMQAALRSSAAFLGPNTVRSQSHALVWLAARNGTRQHLLRRRYGFWRIVRVDSWPFRPASGSHYCPLVRLSRNGLWGRSTCHRNRRLRRVRFLEPRRRSAFTLGHSLLPTTAKRRRRTVSTGRLRSGEAETGSGFSAKARGGWFRRVSPDRADRQAAAPAAHCHRTGTR